MTFGSPGNGTPSRCSERWHGRKKSPDKRPENGRIKSRMTGWLWPNPTSNGGGFRPRIRWGNGMDGGRDVAPRRFRCTYSAARTQQAGAGKGQPTLPRGGVCPPPPSRPVCTFPPSPADFPGPGCAEDCPGPGFRQAAQSVLPLTFQEVGTGSGIAAQNGLDRLASACIRAGSFSCASAARRQPVLRLSSVPSGLGLPAEFYPEMP